MEFLCDKSSHSDVQAAAKAALAAAIAALGVSAVKRLRSQARLVVDIQALDSIECLSALVALDTSPLLRRRSSPAAPRLTRINLTWLLSCTVSTRAAAVDSCLSRG